MFTSPIMTHIKRMADKTTKYIILQYQIALRPLPCVSVQKSYRTWLYVIKLIFIIILKTHLYKWRRGGVVLTVCGTWYTGVCVSGVKTPVRGPDTRQTIVWILQHCFSGVDPAQSSGQFFHFVNWLHPGYLDFVIGQRLFLQYQQLI